MSKKPESSKITPRDRATAGAARRRLQSMEAEIRDAFAVFLDGCREAIQADEARAALDEDLRQVARLLDQQGKKGDGRTA